MNIKKCFKATGYMLRLVTFILFLPITAIWRYKKNSRTAQRFYFAMCSNVMFRLLYSLTFATGIATVNTLYTWYTHDFTCASLTLAVSLPLLFDKIGQPLLAAIRESRQMQFFLMLIALTAMFIPHMLSFAASLYWLLVAAVYYPSRRAFEKFQNPTGIQHYQQCPDTLVEQYFA